MKRGQQQNDEHAASIHDRVVFKQEGLENCLNYDQHLRKSLIDHFWNQDVSLESIANGTAQEQGDFVDGCYSAKVRRNPDRIQVVLKRTGTVFGQSITISKGIALDQGGSELEIVYMIENLPSDFDCHFGVEFNFAGMPDGQDDRYFKNDSGENLGQLGTVLNLHDQTGVQLIDQWLNLSAGVTFESPCSVWTFPIQSVSQSESGFELVHQSVVVQPHWIVRPDQNGRWVTKMKLTTSTGARLGNELNQPVVMTADS